jgi:hypothetical protein
VERVTSPKHEVSRFLEGRRATVRMLGTTQRTRRREELVEDWRSGRGSSLQLAVVAAVFSAFLRNEIIQRLYSGGPPLSLTL